MAWGSSPRKPHVVPPHGSHGVLCLLKWTRLAVSNGRQEREQQGGLPGQPPQAGVRSPEWGLRATGVGDPPPRPGSPVCSSLAPGMVKQLSDSACHCEGTYRAPRYSHPRLPDSRGRSSHGHAVPGLACRACVAAPTIGCAKRIQILSFLRSCSDLPQEPHPHRVIKHSQHRPVASV